MISGSLCYYTGLWEVFFVTKVVCVSVYAILIWESESESEKGKKKNKLIIINQIAIREGISFRILTHLRTLILTT